MASEVLWACVVTPTVVVPPVLKRGVASGNAEDIESTGCPRHGAEGSADQSVRDEGLRMSAVTPTVVVPPVLKRGIKSRNAKDVQPTSAPRNRTDRTTIFTN
jgi:hypothetical protein